MKNDTMDMIIGLAGFVTGLIGIGYAIGTQSKMNQVAKTVNKSIDELANGVTVDIPDEMVDRAINKAVEIRAKWAVDDAINVVKKRVENDLYSKVSNAVDSQYSDLKKVVFKEMTKKAADIDEDSIREDIVEAAKEKALEKFDDNLDDILEKFNSNLEHLSDIYGSIAKTMNKDSERQFTFKI